MKLSSLVTMGAALAIAGAATPAMAGGSKGGWTGGSRPVTQMPAHGGNWNGGHRWGPRQNGRWYAGWGAPGGWGAYRRPVYGYVLPRYWINPTYYIANYGTYGLPAPAYGYGWSRYYDDAVMTDRYGRVYDYRGGVHWDRYEGGYADDDGYYDEPRRDNGVGGAAIGAVVGGVAGNRIAGRGNRTVGTIVGAGVGAVAGAAIDRAEDAPRRGHHGADYDRGRPYGHDGYRGEAPNEYEGRWTGIWTTDDGRSVSGTYDGRFEGDVRGSGAGYAYGPDGHGAGAHWAMDDAPQYAPQYALPAGGYIAGGYYYPAPVVTTVTVQPQVVTTTTTSYVTETVRKPVRRRTVRRCACK